MSTTAKILFKDSKAKCGCGQTVLWKFVPGNSYVRLNEAGTEKHYCRPKLN